MAIRVQEEAGMMNSKDTNCWGLHQIAIILLTMGVKCNILLTQGLSQKWIGPGANNSSKPKTHFEEAGQNIHFCKPKHSQMQEFNLKQSIYVYEIFRNFFSWDGAPSAMKAL